MSSGNFNQFTAIGNLGSDPTSAFTNNGKQWSKFTIATTQGFKGETLWMQCVAWNQLAEICFKYLKKGMKVFIQGSLEIQEYNDSTGTKRTNVQVTLSSMQILTPKKDQQPQDDTSSLPPDEDLEDHPF